MTEITVYRRAVGNADRTVFCEHDCDVEITKSVGPETRQRKRKRIECKTYRMDLIFSHDNSCNVETVSLDEGKLADLFNLSNGYLNKKIGVFSVSMVGKTQIFGYESNDGSVCSTVVSGLSELGFAMRVKHFLDRHDRYRVAFPQLNSQTERDLQVSCAEFVAKFAVDYVMNNDAADLVVMKQEAYKKKCREIDGEDFRRCFKKDVVNLYAKARDLLGLSCVYHPKFLDFYLRHFHEVANTYNEKKCHWVDVQLFVQSIWNLYLS